MWYRVNNFVGGFALALALSVASPSVSQAEGWQENASLADLASSELSETPPALEGKITLVDFWASWCLPCKASFPKMDELYQKYKDQGFQIIAISVDEDQKDADKFLKRLKPSFFTARDLSGSLATEAQLPKMPTSYLVDGSGVIRHVHAGWNGKKTLNSLEAEIKELLKEL